MSAFTLTCGIFAGIWLIAIAFMFIAFKNAPLDEEDDGGSYNGRTKEGDE